MTATQAPQTREELRDRMQTLIRGAESNDVRVEGGYEVRSGDARHDWEVEVVRLAAREGVL